MREYVLALLLAAAVTYLLTPLVRRGAIATGAMHAARTRDVHVVPTPLLGGLALYGGLAAGLLVANQLTYLRRRFPSPRTVPGLLMAGGLLVVTGIIDDRWGMGAISKLAAQVAAGGILVWSQVVLVLGPRAERRRVHPPAAAGPDPDHPARRGHDQRGQLHRRARRAGGRIVAIAACSFLAYCYTLARVVGIHSQSVPALVAALLAGMCIGFLPHNFYPARIFMGDTGAMLLGLLLAYVPLSSTAMFDPNVLIRYSHTVNRYPTVLPLLVPAAILVIPYADLLMAVARRTRAGMSPFAADKKHLHHRLLNVGHSHRQSVLIMYLWAALFTASVVSLSLVRTDLIVLVALTLAAVLALLLVTMPRLRPGRLRNGGRRSRGAGSHAEMPAGAGAVARPGGAAAGGSRDGYLARRGSRTRWPGRPRDRSRRAARAARAAAAAAGTHPRHPAGLSARRVPRRGPLPLIRPSPDGGQLTEPGDTGVVPPMPERGPPARGSPGVARHAGSPAARAGPPGMAGRARPDRPAPPPPARRRPGTLGEPRPPTLPAWPVLPSAG